MNIQKIIKNTFKAGALALALTSSAQVFGQSVPPKGGNTLVQNSEKEIRWLANNDGSNHNEGFGFYVGKYPGSIALRIGHSGNVGIGVYNPEFPLVVNGTAKTNTFITNWVTKNVSNGHLTLGGYPGAPLSRGMYILGNGKVGVGTTNPDAKFHIAGDMKATSGSFSSNLTAANGTFNSNLTAAKGTFSGDLNASNIIANRVRLNVGTFPDYVFAKDYDLMPLEQVEAYIKAHQHLPKVPAAAKVIKEGMDVGQINVLLMEKVEELTLHLIEQNKQMKAMQQRLQKLEKKATDKK
ncbi:cell surface protein [uncultured Microscilla sp.]|uniref:cell surface protein n=1 Tax=uncultured Microscilla sp. TaxID=432653 RepID=UPI0026313BC0|nr:cell surface protein [uncultured Microscilla sp.]